MGRVGRHPACFPASHAGTICQPRDTQLNATRLGSAPSALRLLRPKRLPASFCAHTAYCAFNWVCVQLSIRWAIHTDAFNWVSRSSRSGRRGCVTVTHPAKTGCGSWQITESCRVLGASEYSIPYAGELNEQPPSAATGQVPLHSSVACRGQLLQGSRCSTSAVFRRTRSTLSISH